MSNGRGSRPGGARPLPAAAVLAAMLLPAAASAQTGDGEVIELAFKLDSRAVALSDRVRDALIARADAVLRSCGYDAGDREEPVWRQALAEPSSIHLRYAPPIRLALPRREIPVSEAVFSLGDGDFLGSPVLRHGGRTRLVFKCDGGAMLALMCMPELAAHFPPGYQKNCKLLRSE